MSKKAFGTTSKGVEASLYEISNGGGLRVLLTDYGATVVSIFVKDRDGNERDVILGYDNVKSYEKEYSYFGATVGRYANRISDAKINIDGVEYKLEANDNENSLHSGSNGFSKRFWTVKEQKADEITFEIEDADLEQGFPGNAVVDVTFKVTEENALAIIYNAKADKTTTFNMTNHSYFNLAGQGNIEQQILTLNAPFITETDDALIPTGHDLPVDGLPVDFRAGLRLGKGFARGSEYPMMVAKNGYDFNFTVAGSGMRCFGSLYDPQSGRVMHLCSTEPCVQVYSGQHMDFSGHHGAHYGCHSGLALETQHHPDAIHHAAFPSVVLRANTSYETQTVYSFSVK